jgi:hypothetical protein
MLKFKLIMLFAISFCLIGCDQVRDKLVNSFSWSGTKVDPPDNNHRTGNSSDVFQPKKDNKVDLLPNKPSDTPEQIASRSNPPAVVKTNPIKSNKATPQNRSNDTSGFKDTDW